MIGIEPATTLPQTTGIPKTLFPLNGDVRLRKELEEKKSSNPKKENYENSEGPVIYGSLLHTGRNLGLDARISPFYLNDMKEGNVYQYIQDCFFDPNIFEQKISFSKSLQIGAYEQIEDAVESKITKDASENLVYVCMDMRHIHETNFACKYGHSALFANPQIHRFPTLTLKGIMDVWVLFSTDGIKMFLHETNDNHMLRKGNILICRNLPMEVFLK